MDPATHELDGCDWLFLIDIGERNPNVLRLVVAEGIIEAEGQPVRIGNSVLEDCHPIRVTAKSRRFELLWFRYVSYCVTNESYTGADPAEDVRLSGQLLRRYSRSGFLTYVLGSTLAEALSQGELQHHRLVCADHVIDVVSPAGPEVSHLRE